jgi:predicted CopG family antitoxin
MSSQVTKTIKVKDGTYAKLSERGKYGNTMDDIINDLLKEEAKEK